MRSRSRNTRRRKIKTHSEVTKSALIVGGAAAAGFAVAAFASRRSQPGFPGQTVLITGGSRGLGLALAREFAREGCRVAICARNAQELNAAVQDLERRGAEAFSVSCDVSSREQVQNAIQQVQSRFGRIDLLVNNAGEIQVGPLENMTLEDFERAMNVMFWGTVYPTMALLPSLLQRSPDLPAARIVNVTSIGGKVAVPHLLPYTCAKFAAVGFSEGLRAELAGKNVKVVTIAPGLMRTGSYLNAFFKGDQDREATWFSLGAATPGVSMSAYRAARQIVGAAKRGAAEKVLSTPANALARFHGLFPGVTANILGLAGRLILPAPRGGGFKRGAETAALNSPLLSALTVLGRKAARQFHQQRAPQGAA